MDGWDLSPTDPLQWIYRKWVQELGFDGATVCSEVMDDRVGAKNTKLDGLTIQGKERPIQGYEFPYGLTHQEHDGESVPLFPGKKPPSCGRSLALYISFCSILILYLLVIHVHTWVHVPSTTPSDALWAVVTQIALSRGHVHINGARMLAVSI